MLKGQIESGPDVSNERFVFVSVCVRFWLVHLVRACRSDAGGIGGGWRLIDNSCWVQVEYSAQICVDLCAWRHFPCFTSTSGFPQCSSQWP